MELPRGRASRQRAFTNALMQPCPLPAAQLCQAALRGRGLGRGRQGGEWGVRPAAGPSLQPAWARPSQPGGQCSAPWGGSAGGHGSASPWPLQVGGDVGAQGCEAAEMAVGLLGADTGKSLNLSKHFSPPPHSAPSPSFPPPHPHPASKHWDRAGPWPCPVHPPEGGGQRGSLGPRAGDAPYPEVTLQPPQAPPLPYSAQPPLPKGQLPSKAARSPCARQPLSA